MKNKNNRIGAFGAVVAFAAILRFLKLKTPSTLVFDELYYVRDAWSQLQNGFPTSWPGNDALFNAEIALTMLKEPSYVAHPPLGKWMISLGMIVFGVEDGLGWRAATAFFGVLTVAVLMRIAWLLTKNTWVTVVAGLLLAADGVHVTLSRVSLLDGHLTFLVTLGTLFIVRDHIHVKSLWREEKYRFLNMVDKSGSAKPKLGRIWLFRPWLMAAAITFGLAVGVKWSGVYALFAMTILVVIQDVAARKAFGVKRAPLATALQTLIQLLFLGTVAFLSYLATWAGWLFTSGGWARATGSWPGVLYKYHKDLLAWHSTLQDAHPYASHPLSWPFGLRPTAMFFETADGYVQTITPVPNIFITWGSFAAVVFLTVLGLTVLIKRRRLLVSHPASLALAVSVFGYWSGIIPWVLTPSRSAVFQFYAVVLTPFGTLALALVLASIGQLFLLPAQKRNRLAALSAKRSVTVFLVASVVFSLWMWPMWSGLSQPETVWRSHVWLPGWY